MHYHDLKAYMVEVKVFGYNEGFGTFVVFVFHQTFHKLTVF